MEHIFDVRQVLQNVGDMLRVGGLYVGTTSANNLLGHGFYQFSPELFYRFLCPENGWASPAVFLCEHQRDPPRFWFVEDPSSLGRRIQIQNGAQLNLLVVATKTNHPPSLTTPQQSDYVVAWSGRPSANGASSAPPSGPLLQAGKSLLRSMGAGRLRDLLPRRTATLGLDQPGIRALTVDDFMTYSIPGSAARS